MQMSDKALFSPETVLADLLESHVRRLAKIELAIMHLTIPKIAAKFLIIRTSVFWSFSWRTFSPSLLA